MKFAEPERSCGLYNGQEKETNADCIFASIYTLGMKKHREAFLRDAFDSIIVGEFHHAAAKSYQSLLDYFEPQFLLGITATPDWMEGNDVYALCVRPTESLTVFTQQVGRGLRLFDGKSHCTIIDLIGNYRNADLKLSLFNAGTMTALGCLIDLEVGIINFLEQLSMKKQPRKDKLQVSYMDLKREIGRRPTILNCIFRE